jgi:hypothetical protein
MYHELSHRSKYVGEDRRFFFSGQEQEILLLIFCPVRPLWFRASGHCGSDSLARIIAPDGVREQSSLDFWKPFDIQMDTER